MAPAPTSVIKVGHIDDVQELRKVKPSQVPERFIREKTERPALDKPIPHSSNSIPVIDLSELVNGSKDEFFKLMTSCAEWGFFQVINHGIDVDLVERVEKVAMEFFMMPLEEKQKYQMIPGTVQGYGQAFVFSEDQKLDWCNMFALGVEPHYIRTPKLWPTKPSDFSELSGGYVSGPGISPTLGSHRGDSKTLVSQILSSFNSETVELYSREIKKLCKNLLKYIALTLSLNGDAFEEMFGVAVQAVRMNYYPACPRPDLVLGLSPHSDGSALTILQQGKGSSVGLQILKDDKWIPVQPIPNALVINIGDTIEVLTNGRYKSVEHRAVTHKEKDRLSIVTFYAPSYEIELGPIPELVDDKNPCKYRRYNHGDYSLHYVTNKLQGKKTLEFAKIKN